MISNVKIKNWRSHKETELDFSDGTNTIIGLMGAGKTSVMDAICFALFGTFPILTSKKIKLEDIIMKKPKKEKSSEISVSFNLNGNEYTVKRKIQKGKTEAELRKDGKLIEAPQTQRVTEEVEKLLKVNYDLFTRAVYSEQNQLDIFLTIPKGQRMKKIDQLLAIDKFETARLSNIKLTNKILNSINEKKQLIVGLESDENVKNLPLVKKEIEQIISEEKNHNERLKTINKKRLELEKNLNEITSKEKRYNEIERELKTLIRLMKEYGEDVDKLKEDMVEVAEKTDQDLKENLIKLEGNMKNVKGDLDEEREKIDIIKKSFTEKETKLNIILKERIPYLREKLKEKQNLEASLKTLDPKRLQKYLKEKTENLEKTKERIQRRIVHIENIEESIKELEDAGRSCPICDQILSEKKKENILKRKQNKMQMFKKDKDSSEKLVLRLQKSLQNVNSNIKTSEEMETKLKGITAEEDLKKTEAEKREFKKLLKGEEVELRMMEKNMRIIEKDYEGSRTKYEEAKRIIDKKRELLEKIEKIKEFEKQSSILRNEKAKYLGFSPDSSKAIEKELRETFGLEKQLETKIENMRSIREEKIKRLGELENQLKLLDKQKNEVKSLEAVTDQLKLLSVGLEKTQTQLRKNFIAAINQAMHNIWQDLYPYKDFYSCRLGITEGDYILQLQGSTGWVNVDGAVSGGERSMACLVLRIAFSLVLAPQLRWLVLDEPTHNLDAKTIQDLSNILRDRISDFVEQVFLITHDSALESSVSGYLYRLEREKQKDEPTQVIKVLGPDDHN